MDSNTIIIRDTENTNEFCSILDDTVNFMTKKCVKLSILQEIEKMFMDSVEWSFSDIPRIRMIFVGCENSGLGKVFASISDNNEYSMNKGYPKRVKVLKSFCERIEFQIMIRPEAVITDCTNSWCDIIVILFNLNDMASFDYALHQKKAYDNLETKFGKKPIFLIGNLYDEVYAPIRSFRDMVILSNEYQFNHYFEINTRYIRKENLYFVLDFISRYSYNYRIVNENDKPVENQSNNDLNISFSEEAISEAIKLNEKAIYASYVKIQKKYKSKGLLYLDMDGNLHLKSPKLITSGPLLLLSTKVDGNSALNGYVVNRKVKTEEDKILIINGKFENSELEIQMEMDPWELKFWMALFDNARIQLLSTNKVTLPGHDNTESAYKNILKIPGNEKCGDCKINKAQWFSRTYGITLCSNCIDFHRKDVTCKAQSLILDNRDVEMEIIFGAFGNYVVNNLMEALCPFYKDDLIPTYASFDFHYLKYNVKRFSIPLPPGLSWMEQIIEATENFNHASLMICLIHIKGNRIDEPMNPDDPRTLITLAMALGNDVAFVMFEAYNADLDQTYDNGKKLLSFIPRIMNDGHVSILKVLLEQKYIDQSTFDKFLSNDENTNWDSLGYTALKVGQKSIESDQSDARRVSRRLESSSGQINTEAPQTGYDEELKVQYKDIFIQDTKNSVEFPKLINELIKYLKKENATEKINNMYRLETLYNDTIDWSTKLAPRLKMLAIGNDYVGIGRVMSSVSGQKPKSDEDKYLTRLKTLISINNDILFQLMIRGDETITKLAYLWCDSLAVFFDVTDESTLSHALKQKKLYDTNFNKYRIKPIFLIGNSYKVSENRPRFISYMQCVLMSKQNKFHQYLELNPSYPKPRNVSFAMDFISRFSIISKKDGKFDYRISKFSINNDRKKTLKGLMSRHSTFMGDKKQESFTLHESYVHVIKPTNVLCNMALSKNGKISIHSNKLQLSGELLNIEINRIERDNLATKEAPNHCGDEPNLILTGKFNDHWCTVEILLNWEDLMSWVELFNHVRIQILSSCELTLPYEKSTEFDILKIRGNDKCADCKKNNVKWFSRQFGITLCSTCVEWHQKVTNQNNLPKPLSINNNQNNLEMKIIFGVYGNLVNNNLMETLCGIFRHQFPPFGSNEFYLVKYSDKTFVAPLPIDEPWIRQIFTAVKEFDHIYLMSCLIHICANDINKPVKDGDTRNLLSLAITLGNDVAFVMLVAHGANLDQRYDKNMNILSFIPNIINDGHSNILKVLLEWKYITDVNFDKFESNKSLEKKAVDNSQEMRSSTNDKNSSSLNSRKRSMGPPSTSVIQKKRLITPSLSTNHQSQIQLNSIATQISMGPQNLPLKPKFLKRNVQSSSSNVTGNAAASSTKRTSRISVNSVLSRKSNKNNSSSSS